MDGRGSSSLRRVRGLLVVETVLFGVGGLWGLLVTGTGQTFSSLLLVVIALVCAVAALDVRRELERPRAPHHDGLPPPSSLVSVVLAHASLVPVLLVPLWAEVHSGVHDILDGAVVVVSLLLLGAAAVLLAGAVRARPSSALSRSWVAALALLPLAGSVQFWYSTFYRPTHQRPDVNIEATLQPVGSAAGTTRLLGTVALKNDGATDLDLFDAVYVVSRPRPPTRCG